MVYHAITLGPTQGQLMDLTDGEEVKLGNHHLKGDVTFQLTTAQMKKIHAAAAAGRGCTLKLTKAQIAHHAKHGSGIMQDMSSAVWDASKGALKEGAKAGLKFGMDKAGGYAKAGASKLINKGSSMIQDKLERMFGLRGSGLFEGTKVTPAQMRQLEQLHTQHGTGFLSGLLGSFGLGIDDGTTFAEQRGAGFLSSILKKLAHGAVDVVGGLAGAGVTPQRRHGTQGKGFIGSVLKKLAHGAVDVIAGAAGAGVNPLANPNEGLAAALFQKKAVAGRGIYVPGRA